MNGANIRLRISVNVHCNGCFGGESHLAEKGPAWNYGIWAVGPLSQALTRGDGEIFEWGDKLSALGSRHKLVNRGT